MPSVVSLPRTQLFREEMGGQFLVRNEGRGLLEQRTERSSIELIVKWNHQSLLASSGEDTTELDVTSPLGKSEESELAQNPDDVCPGKSSQLTRHGKLSRFPA